MKNNLKGIINKLKKFHNFEDTIRRNNLLLSPDKKLARLNALIELALKITPLEKLEKIRNDKIEYFIDMQKKLTFIKTQQSKTDRK